MGWNGTLLHVSPLAGQLLAKFCSRMVNIRFLQMAGKQQKFIVIHC